LKDIPESLDFVGRTYSKDMRGVIWYLLGNPGPLKNIDDILSMLAPRMLFELSTTQQYVHSFIVLSAKINYA
jgi:PAB-dependent poly(A)-specific ribonuclease subunit 3